MPEIVWLNVLESTISPSRVQVLGRLLPPSNLAIYCPGHRLVSSLGAALENSPHVKNKNSLFVPRMQKKRKKRRPEVKKGELATPEVKPEPPPSPISSQRHHIDCGDDFAMFVLKVTDLAT